MSEGAKVGARVDAEVYERFREWVRDRHGRVRGVLGEELENAMRDRMSGGSDLDRIDARLARLERAVVPTEADGGDPLDLPSSRTHAPAPKPDENAPRSQKVEYLAGLAEATETTRDDLDRLVEREFGFAERTREDYVDMLVEVCEFRPDPRPARRRKGILLSPERHAEVVDDYRAPPDGEG